MKLWLHWSVVLSSCSNSLFHAFSFKLVLDRLLLFAIGSTEKYRSYSENNWHIFYGPQCISVSDIVWSC